MDKTKSQNVKLNQTEQGLVKVELYQIILKNTQCTPMNLMNDQIRRLFDDDHQIAQFMALGLWRNGQVVCGVYPKARAREMLKMIRAWSKKYQIGLTCELKRL